MSIWTCKAIQGGGLLQAAALLGVVLALSGCMGEAGGGLGFLTAGQTQGEAGRAVPIAREARLGAGTVIVIPPVGYCLDRSSITDRPSGGFALIASCESLTGRMGSVAVDPAVITVTVSGPGENRDQPQAARLAQALPEGTALNEINGDGLTVVHVEGRAGALPGARGDARHWRGAMVVNDRLVGLALYSAEGSNLAGADGERMLVTLAELIRENSPFLPGNPGPDNASAAPQPAGDTAEPQPLRKLFGRLFP